MKLTINEASEKTGIPEKTLYDQYRNKRGLGQYFKKTKKYQRLEIEARIVKQYMKTQDKK